VDDCQFCRSRALVYQQQKIQSHPLALVVAYQANWLDIHSTRAINRGASLPKDWSEWLGLSAKDSKRNIAGERGRGRARNTVAPVWLVGGDSGRSRILAKDIPHQNLSGRNILLFRVWRVNKDWEYNF
jgi:hypothetical protein